MAVFSLLAAILLLILLSYKGIKIFLSALIACVVVLLLNGMDLWQNMSQVYVAGFTSFLSGYIFMLTIGALFGRLLSASGCARSLSLKLLSVFGEKKIVAVIIAATSVFCLAGVNLYVVIYAVYPIAVVIGQRQNIYKGVIGAAIWCTAFTVGFPGAISLPNALCSQYLGTRLTSGALIGLAGSAVTLFLCVWYTYRLEKRSRAQGLTFEPGPQDHIYLAADLSEQDLPHWSLAALPLLVVALVGVGLSFTYDSVFSVVTAMLLACLVIAVSNWRRLKGSLAATIGDGLMEGFSPLLSICALTGFGAVIKATPGFQEIVAFVLNLDIHPYLSAYLSTNLLVGTTGSMAGGLTIFLDTLSPSFLEMGVNPDILHRIAAMSSCGLDSLPHSAGIIGQLAVMQLSVKQGYKHAFFNTVVATSAGALVAVILGILFY